MKKIICVVLALMMAFSLAGCGQNEKKAEDKIELVVWAHNDEESWTESYQAIADAFMAENENIKITFEYFPYDEFESKVLTSLTSKSNGADIYELWGGWCVDYASTGALAAVPNDMAEEIRKDAYPSTYGALEYDGKLYGMPMEFNIESGAMLANLKVLEENGMSVATTWDELIDQAKALSTEESGNMTMKGFDFVNWDGVPYLFTSMILSQGANYLNDDGSFNFTSDEARKAFDEITGLVIEDKVTNLDGLVDDSGLEGYQQLYAGRAAYVPRGPWAINEGLTTFGLTYGEDFDYVSLPWYGDKSAFAAETGWSMAVNSSSDKQEAAFKFLEYFFSDDVIMSHNLACAQIPAKQSVAQSETYLEKFPYAKPLVGILGDAQFIGYFNTDVFKEIINGVFVDYCTGGIYADADAALADLEARLNAM